jgi:hypothetical protein
VTASTWRATEVGGALNVVDPEELPIAKKLFAVAWTFPSRPVSISCDILVIYCRPTGN